MIIVKIKVAIIGAGSVVFTQNLLNDILSYTELKDSIELFLMDINQDRLNTAFGIAQRLIGYHSANVKVFKTIDQVEAIKGAKYVINTVQVGGIQATKTDFDIPEKYGLKQTIGDTHGIGGIFRAIRTVPVVLDLSYNMEKYCSNDAVLLNYSNPMAMVTWSVFANTSINVIGLCHSIQGTAHQLASYMGLNYSELQYKAGGINHLDWFLELKVNGKDIYPRLWEAMKNEDVYQKDKVRFEFMKLFGYFVSESSEHLAEYLPYFIKEDKKISELDIPIREYIRRSVKNNDEYENNKKIALGEEPLPVLKKSVEYASRIIYAMETGKHTTIHGNIKNTGLIPNLPINCCVEVPILINKNGFQPTYFGELPPQLAGINKWHITVQELTLKGIIEKRKDYIYHAALLDPLANSMLKVDQIIKIVDELFEAYHEITSNYQRYR